MILDFIRRNYHPEQMVITVAGDIKWPRLLQLITKYFYEIPHSSIPPRRLTMVPYHPIQIEEQKETVQSHAIIGSRAYSYLDENFTAMILLNNLLGGPAMNSRLNLNIREKYGFAYNIESFYSPYSDTGAFGIYIGTHKGSLQRSIELIIRELHELRTKPLGKVQLSKAKTQLIGQIALSQENNLALAIALGKSMLNYGRIDTLEDVHQKIDSITADQLMQIAHEIFDESKLSTIIYKAK
jgi:predicted Zn-dependent peptidase